MTQEIAIYGTSAEITSAAQRLRTAMKGGEKLSAHEAMVLAQLATVTKLNPFTGEIWMIPGKGPMIGIAGARRLFNEQADGFIEIIPTSPEEAGATEKDVVVAFKAIAHNRKANAEYQRMMVETIAAMRAAGSPEPFGPAKEICGPRPSWVGYGYSTHGESSRMNKTQLARKRAEADALKKVINVPFELNISIHDQAPTNYIEEPIEAQAEDVSDLYPADDARMINPMGMEQVQYAAREWNIAPSEAAKAIAGRNLPKQITWSEFQKIVTG